MPRKKSAPAKSTSLTSLLFIVIALSALAWVLTRQLPFQNPLTQPDTIPAPAARVYISDPIDLPSVSLSSRTSVEAALNSRRSRRTFLDKPLSISQVSQLLWAAQGVTTDWGGRTTPSAKSAYPLEVYLIANNVEGLDPGLYHYIPGDLEPVHQLGVIKIQNLSEEIAEAAQQASSKDAAAIIIIAADFQRMYDKFDGNKLDNNVYLEVGHAAENLYLQSESLGLGMVVTGGFDHDLTKQVISLPENENLIYLIPIGYPGE